MIKIFVSTGFNGRNQSEIYTDFLNAKVKLNNYFGEECAFVNGLRYDSLRSDNNIEALSECIYMMGDANFIYFCENWQNYRGCRIEHRIAEEYNLPIIYWYNLD